MKRVTIFDYGAGNLHSLAKALAGPGRAVEIEGVPRRALNTDLLVLPGVGAFQLAASRLAPVREEVADALRGGLPAIGVCLGMQLLFDGSDEGPGRGLGIASGRVTRLRAMRVPHIGWNGVERAASLAPDDAFARTPLDVAYFAHSFACRPFDDRTVLAWTTDENDRFPAAIRVGRTVGVQFHPEKSSRAGVALLHALVEDALR
jgi:imidazole glycerol-phosphate synthase subunit HisH